MWSAAHFIEDDPHCLGSLQIDDELEFGRPQDRHFGWLLALENTAGIDAGLQPLVHEARPVTQATAHSRAG